MAIDRSGKMWSARLSGATAASAAEWPTGRQAAFVIVVALATLLLSLGPARAAQTPSNLLVAQTATTNSPPHQQQAAPSTASSTASSTGASSSEQSSSAQQASEAGQREANEQRNSAPSSEQAGNSNGQFSPQQPLKLPNINVYVNKNEIRKLLGIDTRINYVTNGNINTYPLGFTIPLGYNQSDIIFTWQNLGTTNVNYSISLVIGNIHAVERPLINITRSGLIPRHEQVFKITLPCSGRVTDEVDVQILINILGWVPVEQDEERFDSIDSAVQQQQLAADYQIARAVAAASAPDGAAAAPSGSANQTAFVAANSDQMQADEATSGQPMMRLVSHTLAIKRKKICTMHPVPVQPALRPSGPPAELLRPPTQFILNSQVPSPAPPPFQPTVDPAANRWAPAQQQQQVNSPTATASAEQGASAQRPKPPSSQLGHFQQQPASSNNELQPAVEPPAHHPSLSSLPLPLNSNGNNNLLLSTSTMWPPNLRQQHQQMPPSVLPAPAPSPIPPENPLNELAPLQHAPAGQTKQQQQQSAAPSGSSLLVGLLVAISLVVALALVALLLLALSSHTTHKHHHHTRPLDKLNALTNCLLRRKASGSSANSTHTLARCATHNHTNHHHQMHLHAKCKQQHHHLGHHSDSLSGHSPASSSAPSPTAGGKSAFTLRGPSGGPFANSSSIILGANPMLRHHHQRTISGQSKQQQPLCFASQANNKLSANNNYATGTMNSNTYYSTMNYSQQQQAQQQPPTADLLGTGYQCQQNYSIVPPLPPPLPPIYHIATGNPSNQTTRLIWQQERDNGYTIDTSRPAAFEPLAATGQRSCATNLHHSASNGAQSASDNGSVYQTIY